jgi:hypothetical protein
MRCHSVGYGMPSRMMQYATQSFAAGHIALIRVYDNAGNVIETRGQAGDFKEW